MNLRSGYGTLVGGLPNKSVYYPKYERGYTKVAPTKIRNMFIQKAGTCESNSFFHLIYRKRWEGYLNALGELLMKEMHLCLYNPDSKVRVHESDNMTLTQRLLPTAGDDNKFEEILKTFFVYKSLPKNEKPKMLKKYLAVHQRNRQKFKELQRRGVIKSDFLLDAAQYLRFFFNDGFLLRRERVDRRTRRGDVPQWFLQNKNNYGGSFDRNDFIDVSGINDNRSGFFNIWFKRRDGLSGTSSAHALYKIGPVLFDPNGYTTKTGKRTENDGLFVGVECEFLGAGNPDNETVDFIEFIELLPGTAKLNSKPLRTPHKIVVNTSMGSFIRRAHPYKWARVTLDKNSKPRAEMRNLKKRLNVEFRLE